jgi:hypothetical protein
VTGRLQANFRRPLGSLARFGRLGGRTGPGHRANRVRLCPASHQTGRGKPGNPPTPLWKRAGGGGLTRALAGGVELRHGTTGPPAPGTQPAAMGLRECRGRGREQSCSARNLRHSRRPPPNDRTIPCALSRTSLRLLMRHARCREVPFRAPGSLRTGSGAGGGGKYSAIGYPPFWNPPPPLSTGPHRRFPP